MNASRTADAEINWLPSTERCCNSTAAVAMCAASLPAYILKIQQHASRASSMPQEPAVCLMNQHARVEFTKNLAQDETRPAAEFVPPLTLLKLRPAELPAKNNNVSDSARNDNDVAV
jgi:hypothetical protein